MGMKMLLWTFQKFQTHMNHVSQSENDSYISQKISGHFEMFLEKNAQLDIGVIESVIVSVDPRTSHDDRKNERYNLPSIKAIIYDLVRCGLMEYRPIEQVHKDGNLKCEQTCQNGTPESIVGSDFVALISQMAVEL